MSIVSVVQELPHTLLDLARSQVDPISFIAKDLRLGERDAALRLAAAFEMPHWETMHMLECVARFDLLPLPRGQQIGAALMARNNELFAVVVNPFEMDLQLHLEHVAGCPISLVLATASDLQAWFSQQEAQTRAVDNLGHGAHVAGLGESNGVEVLSLTALSEASSQTVRVVNSTLYDALRVGASDVHFESTPDGLTVKYRVDGALDLVTRVPGTSVAQQVMSRLKVMAELDIAESRVPQDGSFRVMAQAREIDLRVSIMPSIHGEDAVVRILDKQGLVAAGGTLTLDALGFDQRSLQTLRALMRAPYGMLLVTGPTGDFS